MFGMYSYWESLLGVFGAAPINPQTLYQLQDKAPNLMVYTLPVILLLMVLEFVGAKFSQNDSYEREETIGSLWIGLGSLTVNLLLKSVLITGAIWIYNQLPWRMELNWWMLPICFLAYDFCSYWSHRISHYNRFFWASHVVHHSADHYNLTVAFRQSWVQHFKTIFFIPVALLGFHPLHFFVASQLSTLYQFWVHTEAIGKLHPFIEKCFGTPSNHRVHHGSQEKYLDKNFGATFMIWDHLFGSFQYETEKPIYGLTTAVTDKKNPFSLNFDEYRAILTDLKQSDGLKEMLFFMFASPARIYRYKYVKVASEIKTHRKVNRLIGVVVLLVLILIGQLTFSQTPEMILPTPKGKDLLFFLQRTPDANTVIYEVNYKSDGEIDPEFPVRGSWIRYEEQGKLKALSKVEERFAYGVKCKAIAKDTFEIRLAAYQKMPMYLMRSATDQRYRMYIKDEGKNLLLKRVFVKVKSGSALFPKVQYIDLITTNCSTGLEILKRINLG